MKVELLLLLQLFIAAAVITVMYVLLFLVLLGVVSFPRPDTNGQSFPVSKAISHQRVAIAKRMLWFVLFVSGSSICSTLYIGIQPVRTSRHQWIKNSPGLHSIFHLHFAHFCNTSRWLARGKRS